MSATLFLGNSHLSAFKFAHAGFTDLVGADCRFFCARAADFAFTEVRDGTIRPSDAARVDDETLLYSHGGTYEDYMRRQHPTEDLAVQWRLTGLAPEIDLAGIQSVFHVYGTSPYDFLRLGEIAMKVTARQRRWLLGRMLGEKFLTRVQIEAMRRFNPTMRHYLIGMPVPARDRQWQVECNPALVTENRHIIRSMARDFLFDDVFMPGSHLLDDTLMRTRHHFARGGRQEAEVFQDRAPTFSDNVHMNRAYGEAVFRDFIQPCLQQGFA